MTARKKGVVAPDATGTEESVELTVGQKMSSTLRKYRAGYETTRSSSGKKSLDKGDKVAKALRGMTPLQVCQLAENILHDCDAVARYAKLNPGQQRMNAGNLIRNAIKRCDIREKAVLDAAKKVQS